MSNYNSTNTHVLETHEQAGGNTRMLLFHICDSGRHEYVVGSYFNKLEGKSAHECKVCGEWWSEPITSYEWTWGHYFSNVVNAVTYWKREVLGVGEDYVE